MLHLTNVVLRGVIYASEKKLKIMSEDLVLWLNKKSELVPKCHHKTKLILANIK